VVFTNVEPAQRLARLGRPAPIVALVRATSDEDARALARELDEAAAGEWRQDREPSQDPERR
jgi:acyl-CoA reductase-like NAD-dependent aldehyde dehydrogenase